MHHHEHPGTELQAQAETAAIDASSTTRGQSKGYVVIAIVYLLGLCIGALDMGIVNPARTVIQNTLGVGDSLGVWILTIYTLAYAASIPIMGKLADRHGRKYIYLACIVLFGGGSALCGVAHDIGSFELLIGARAIQALGGGGIMPVATAEFGTAFPEEKRGMALGMVGMVYGLASIFGSSAGSLILDIFGQTQWQFIFYVNIPICIVIFALGIFKLPNSKADEVPPIDILGAMVLTVMTLSLMYGLKNIDFFDLENTIASTDVYPFLIAFVVLLPIFVLVERRAKDPIMNLSYFAKPNIVIALICAIISGIIMMGTIFFPQFAENSLFLKSGAGGYFTMILGLGSGAGAMLSGKLIDRHGVKPVLAIGFIGSLAGSLFMALVACNNPTIVNVCIMLVLTGLGLGFTMGTPLNYMMLQNTTDAESNSALATLSLVRSIGTAVAPAIMVAFVAHAGLSMQDNIMAVLPSEVTVSPLPYAKELDAELEEMRQDPDTADMLKDLDIPKLSSYETIEVDMDGSNPDFDVEVSDEMVQKMQDSDVTTIVDTCKEMSAEMFNQVKPKLIVKATDGIDKGIEAMQGGLDDMDDAISEMENGLNEMDANIPQMQGGLDEMDGQLYQMQSGIDEMDSQIAQMQAALDAMRAMDSANAGPGPSSPEGASGEGSAGSGTASGAGSMPSGMGGSAGGQTPEDMEKAIAEMQAARNELATGRDQMAGSRDELQNGLAEMQSGRSELQSSIAELKEARGELADTISKLEEVKEALPGTFEEAGQNYLAEIDKVGPEIQEVYRSTLNGGFKGMAFFVAACAAAGLIVLVPYRDKKRKGSEVDAASSKEPAEEALAEAGLAEALAADGQAAKPTSPANEQPAGLASDGESVETTAPLGDQSSDEAVSAPN